MALDTISDSIQLRAPLNKIGVSEYFAGQDVFITGGLGFMGKVLIEKILWSCEDVGNVYFLVRAKKGHSIKERVEKLLELPIFDRIKKHKPSCFGKLIPIEGDVLEPNLGISEDNRTILENNVSIIFHVASSVRFDDPLKKSILINIRGTKYIVDLAKRVKKLKVLVYVSTTFCNVKKERIQEKIYPTKDDWRDIITMAETLDEDVLNAFTAKILDDHPNTYTFTKFLAENLIYEYSKELPCVIFRPSIVTFSINDPKPGWIDNLNGAVGICIGVMTGIVRVISMELKIPQDNIPCDYAINGLLVSTWYKGTSNLQECLIVNCANGGKGAMNYGFLNRNVLKTISELPTQQLIWYPYIITTTNKFLYDFLFLFLHILPGMFIDLILKRSNFKFRLIPIYRKVYFLNNVVLVFITKSWEFDTIIFDSLKHFLSPEDKKTFFYDMSTLNNYQFVKTGIEGMKKYILKEKSTKEASKAALKHYNRMYWLHQFTKCFLSILLLMLVWPILKRFTNL